MINVLVLCDDYWHPAEVIKRGLRNFKSSPFAFDFVMDAKDILTPRMLKYYPAIINCKGNNLNSANSAPWFEDGVTETGVKDFRDYVCGGGGFLSIHAANTAKKGEEYGEFVGNIFLGHPPRCEIDVIISGTHPIVRGVENFSIRDEHYQLDYFATDAVELFFTSSEAGGRQIGGYAREMGKGRLCVMTPGHILSVWEHPSFQQLLLNALHWCTKQ
ncbi:MAG: ThuA domain-containing protein [Treponema sp.]|jgi:type 1 glutamine amidotransferase|nr:ThuA domain-containing protein [Treponema sp.]